MKKIIWLLLFFLPFIGLSQSVDGPLKTITASGTNTYTIVEPLPATYTVNERFLVKFTNANTGAATLNRAGLGATPLQSAGAIALNSGDIKAGEVKLVEYNGTYYQIVGGSGGGGGGGAAWLLASGGALTGANTISGVFALNFTNTGGFTINGSKLQVTTTSTTAGLNLGTFAGDPSSPVNADLWYNGSTNLLKYSAGGVSRLLLDVGTSGIASGQVVIGSGSATASSFAGFTYAGVSGQMVLTQPSLSSGWLPMFLTTPGAHTSLTSATEFLSRNFAGATWTWLAGTVATQRQNYFSGFTLAGSAATAIFTNAYTVYVDPPVAGTNATITNSWGLGVNGNVWLNASTSQLIVGSNGSSGLAPDGGIGLKIGGIANGGGWSIKVVDNGGAVAYAMFSPGSLTNAGGNGAFAFGSVTTTNANFYINQGTLTSAWKPALRIDPGAHTAITNTLENIDFDFGGGSVTQSWAGSGTVALQRSAFFRGRTLAATSPQTFTKAYGLYVGSNVAGTNTTITQNFGIGTDGDIVAEKTAGKIAVVSGGNQIGFNAGGVGMQIGWLASGSGNAIDFVDNGASVIMMRLQGSAVGTSLLLNSITNNANLYGVQQAQSSSWRPALRIDPGAHTSMTAATEFISNDFQGATQTWLAGTVATQRLNYFRGFTLAGASATATFTNAYTVYVDRPVQGTNATITNNWGIGTNGSIATLETGGGVQIGGALVLGIRETAGVSLDVGAVWGSGGTGFAVNFYDNSRGWRMGTILNGSVQWQLTGINYAKFATTGNILTQSALSSGWLPTLQAIPGAHTAMTAATEFISNDFQGATQTWLAGTVATQRLNYFRGFTLAGASATAAFTNAYTVYIDPPVLGTNASIGNKWAIGTGAGGNISVGTNSGHVNFLDVAVGSLAISFPSNNVGLGLLSGGSLLSVASNGGGFLFSDQNGGSITPTARVHVFAGGQGSGWVGAFTVTPGAHTSLTAATEFLSNDFQGATQTWLAGTVATQRLNYFRGFTLAGASATATFTNAYTVYVDPPVVGANAAITNNYALGIAGDMILTPTGSVLAFGVRTSRIRGNAGNNGFIFEQAIASATNTFVTLTQSAHTGGSPVGLLYSGGAHTTLTASAEATDISLNLGRTIQWATGALVTQRMININAPTLAFVGASTITNASLLYLNNAPIAGTNATLTNSHVIYIDAANSVAAGTTNSYGITANAQTGATSNFSAQFLGGLGIKIAQAAQSATHTFVAFTQSIHTGGSPTGLLYTGGAHTTLTASVESVDINFSLNRTVQFSTGALATQRNIVIQPATYGFVAASTITNAYGVNITSAPIAGTNATLTNSIALAITTGAVGAGVTNSYGLSVAAMTGAATNNYAGAFSGGNTLLAAGTTTYASTRMPHGAAPTAPVDGDIWTTTTGMFARINGSTVGPFAAAGGGGWAVTGSTTITGNTTQTGAFTETFAMNGVTITQNVIAAATPPSAFTVTGGAHTTVTLSTEAIDVNLNLARTVQWATGALAAQRAVNVAAPTYGFVAASTITRASTISISGPPVAGTNATITDGIALDIVGGAVAAGTGTGTGLFVTAPTGATTATYAIQSSGNIKSSSSTTGNFIQLIEAAHASVSSPTGFQYIGGAHTNLTIATNVVDFQLNLNRTIQWATGAKGVHQSVNIAAPTLAFVGASTITNASLLYLNNAPIAGTNATLTNSHVIYIDAANSVAAGTTNSYGITANAQTGATSNFSAQFLGGLGIKIAQAAQSATHTFVAFTQSIHTGGSPTGLLYTGGAHTTLTASVESPDINFNLTRTVQFATGALSLQRSFIIGQPTLGFVGASTVTDAATVYITGAPVAGTNATLTNAWALYIAAGNMKAFGKWVFDVTDIVGGTTGAQTINKPTGSVNIAAAGTSVVVTNSLATATSHIFVCIETVDTTAKSAVVTRAAGSFTITLNAATTAEVRISFMVVN